MLEIDPQLRGGQEAEENHEDDQQQDQEQQQQQQRGNGETLPDAPTDAYLYPEEAQLTSAAHDDATTAENDRVALAQALTTEDLPYYSGQLQGLPAGTSSYQPISFTPHEPRKRPRSCESCRGLKVKCEPNETGTGPCKRCAKAGRECLYTESSGRRKKKEDNKVKELEQKVNGLTAALLAQRGAAASESLIYDDASLLQSALTEDEGSTRKRRRSEFEGDRDVESPLRAAKHRAMSASNYEVDLREFDGLAKQKVMSDFCTNLKFLEAWFQKFKAQHDARVKASKKSSEVNGTSNRGKGAKAEASTNGSDEATSNSSGGAPTAQMVRTPLDLLSQVASGEQPSAANSAQNEWYSPYASATQDASGYYDLKKEEGSGESTSTALNGSKSDLEELFHTEFGNRGSLVLHFLNTFISGSGTKSEEEGR